jgi:hypothetical protein
MKRGRERERKVGNFFYPFQYFLPIRVPHMIRIRQAARTMPMMMPVSLDLDQEPVEVGGLLSAG